MTIYLNKALRWQAANSDEQDMLRDLQANILKGHGRDHTLLLFLRFESTQLSQARAFVRGIARYVTTAHQQLTDTEALTTLAPQAQAQRKLQSNPVILFFLTAAGYRALGIAAERLPPDPAFRAGFKARVAMLHAPPPTQWEVKFQEPLHALLLIADATAQFVQQARQLVMPPNPGVTVIGSEVGRVLRNAQGDVIEHFGYASGRSQPLMLVEDIERERERLAADLVATLDTALVKDPNGRNSTCFGSYLVFQKLAQDVRRFKAQVETLAQRLELGAEAAAALVMGRFADGTPLALAATPSGQQPIANNFDCAADPQGLRCPWHAHIRKMNPRDATDGSRHWLVRRSITYGERERDSAPQDRPSNGVGLLFMAYQSHIESQFEFLQKNQANAVDFPHAGAGLDPIAGRGPAHPQHWPRRWGQNELSRFEFHNCATLQGGEYFFAPCLSFMQNL